MKVFLDANLLIYLNTLTDTETRSVYEEFYLDLVANHRLYTDVLVLDELLYISRKRYGIPYRVTAGFIESIVMPYTDSLPLGRDEYLEASRIVVEKGLKPSDALHAAAAKLASIQVIASEDREFDKLGFLKRVWVDKRYP